MMTETITISNHEGEVMGALDSWLEMNEWMPSVDHVEIFTNSEDEDCVRFTLVDMHIFVISGFVQCVNEEVGAVTRKALVNGRAQVTAILY